jgi:hypothetical protein
LIGNGSSSFTTKTNPSGDFVGTSDVQTLTNKSIASTQLTGNIASARIVDALNASGSAPIYAVRSWVNFDGTGTVSIRSSGNVSSVTDNGTGNYTVNFTTAMPDANYAATGTARDPEGENTPMVFTPEASDLYTTTQFQFHTRAGSGSLVDVPTATVVIVR